MEKGLHGENYLLAGENMTYASFFRRLQKNTVHHPLFVHFPTVVLLILGAFGSLLRLLGVKTALSYTNARILCVKTYYTNKKTTHELGVQFSPIDKGIQEALDWFKRNDE